MTDRPVPKPPQWTGLSQLPEFSRIKFPRFRGRRISINAHGGEAIDLLHRMLELDPKRRITALDALKHSYFDTLSNEDRMKLVT